MRPGQRRDIAAGPRHQIVIAWGYLREAEFAPFVSRVKLTVLPLLSPVEYVHRHDTDGDVLDRLAVIAGYASEDQSLRVKLENRWLSVGADFG